MRIAKLILLLICLMSSKSILSMEKDSLQFIYSTEEVEEVSKFISKRFGNYDMVMGEKSSEGPRIDIAIIEPTKKRNYYTLCTIGLGAYKMNIDEENFPLAQDRIELLIYLPADWPISPDKFADENNYWPVRLLKSIARVPYYENSFLTFGHTFSNSEEATYAENTDKVGAILLSPIPDPLEPVICQLSSDKEVEFLQVFPVTKDEMLYRKTYDSNTLIARLEDTKKASGVKKWIDFALSRMTSAK